MFPFSARRLAPQLRFAPRSPGEEGDPVILGVLSAVDQEAVDDENQGVGDLVDELAEAAHVGVLVNRVEASPFSLAQAIREFVFLPAEAAVVFVP